MSMDVDNVVMTPTELSKDLDFTVPVYLSKALVKRHIDHAWFDDDARVRQITRVLRSCRKEIDGFWGLEDLYDVDCFLVVGIHPCCESHCIQHIRLEAEYQRNDQGDVWLLVTLADESKAA